MKKTTPQLTREMVGGEWYEHVPLGEHVVAAPGVCGGRPMRCANGFMNLIFLKKMRHELCKLL